MKKHLETNYRFPLFILILLIVATLLASFYAGSQTAGVFHFSPRAFFEGPFLGIGIGDLPGFLQPGFKQTEQGQVSTEPKLCLVCNENGYCENDVFSNALSTCVYANSSVEQRAACNQECAQRTHDSNGKKIAFLSQAGTGCSYPANTFRCLDVGQDKYRIQECTECKGKECNSTGYWNNTDSECDKSKGELCDAKTGECTKTVEGDCTLDDYTCISGKQYHCEKSGPTEQKATWVKKDCPATLPICDPESGGCVKQLTSCPENLRGVTECQNDPGGLSRATTCNDAGTGIVKEVCGLGEICKPGKGGGCELVSTGNDCKYDSEGKGVCSGDRKNVLECNKSGKLEQSASCDGKPICVYDATNGAYCSTTETSKCDADGYTSNDTRCSLESAGWLETCTSNGDEEHRTYEWKTIRQCPGNSCINGSCTGTSTPPPKTNADKCKGQTEDCPKDGKFYSTKCEEDKENAGEYKLNCYRSGTKEECKDVEKPCPEATECINLGEEDEPKWDWNDDKCDAVTDPNAEKCKGKAEPLDCDKGKNEIKCLEKDKVWNWSCEPKEEKPEPTPKYCVPQGNSGCVNGDQCCGGAANGCNGGCCGHCGGGGGGGGGGGCNWNPDVCLSYPCQGGAPGQCCPNGQCKCGC